MVINHHNDIVSIQSFYESPNAIQSVLCEWRRHERPTGSTVCITAPCVQLFQRVQARYIDSLLSSHAPVSAMQSRQSMQTCDDKRINQCFVQVVSIAHSFLSLFLNGFHFYVWSNIWHEKCLRIKRFATQPVQLTIQICFKVLKINNMTRGVSAFSVLTHNLRRPRLIGTEREIA